MVVGGIFGRPAIFKRFSGDSLFGFCEDGDPDDDEVEVEVLE
jgi:hypothetical protein